MTILITDRYYGDSYEAHSVDDCRDETDANMYRLVEAYRQTEVAGFTVYERVEG